MLVRQPLDDCRSKIERAEEHLVSLREAVNAFMALDPYGVTLDTDAATGQRIGRAHIARLPPDRIAAIVGDVVHNLRTALDYLAYQLVLRNSPNATARQLRDVYFPCCIHPKGTEEHKTSFERKVSGTGLAFTLLEDMQPCHEPRGLVGQGILDLNTLDIGDKHHALRIVAGAFIDHQLEVFKPGHPYHMKFTHDDPAHSVSPLTEGAELFRLPDEMIERLIAYRLTGGTLTQADMDAQVTFQLVLADVRPGEDEPILDFMTQLLARTRSIVRVFDKPPFF